jgi:Helix-turn-helix domain
MNDGILLREISPQQLKDLISESTKSALDQLSKQLHPTEPDEWLTRKETSNLLKISLVCLHDWCNKGILKPYKVGNRTYFNRKEINELLFNSNS